MFIATTILTIFCAWKWGDWKNWQKYYPTMLFITMSDLLYNYLYYGHWLWKYRSMFIQKNTIPTLLATFIILPISGLIFLSNFPGTWKGLFARITKFVIIYMSFELVFDLLGIIIHERGWNLWWSLSWNIVMYSIWALHYKKPLLAYPAGAELIMLMNVKFPI